MFGYSGLELGITSCLLIETSVCLEEIVWISTELLGMWLGMDPGRGEGAEDWGPAWVLVEGIVRGGLLLPGSRREAKGVG